MSEIIKEEQQPKHAKSYRLAARHHQLIEKAQNSGGNVEAQQKVNQRDLENLTHDLSRHDEAEFARIYFEELRRLAEGDMQEAAEISDKSHKSSFVFIGILILIGLIILTIIQFFPNILENGSNEGGHFTSGSFSENLDSYYAQKEMTPDWQITSIREEGSSFYVIVDMPNADATAITSHNIALQPRIVASLCPKENDPVWQAIDQREIIITIAVEANSPEIPNAVCKDYFAGGISYPAITYSEIEALLSLSGPQNLRGGQGKVTIR